MKTTAVFPLRVAGLKNRPGDACEYELPRMGGEVMVGRISTIDRVMETADGGLRYRVNHTVADTSEDHFAWDALTEEKDLPLSTLEFSTVGAVAPTEAEALETSTPPSGDPPTGGSSQVVVTWKDPQGGDVALKCVRVRLMDGGTEIDVQDITEGVETVTFSEGYLAGPLTVGLRAEYEDNTTSGEVSVTAI